MAKTDFFQRADKELEVHAAKQTNNTAAAPAPAPAPAAAAPAPAAPAAGAAAAAQAPAKETPAPATTGATTAQAKPPQTNTTAAASPGGAEGAGAQGEGAAQGSQQQQETEEQIALRVLKANGIDVSDLGQLNERVNNRPVSEADKKKAEEKRRRAALQIFTDQGLGTMDDFYRQESLRTADDKVLAKSAFVSQLKTLNKDITDQEADELFSRQFFVGDQDEYEPWQVELGKARLKEMADGVRARETAPLSKVEQQLIDYESELRHKREWEATVNNFVPSMPKNLTVPLGKYGDKELGEFNYTLSEDEQREIANELKDPATLLNIIKDKKTDKVDMHKLYRLLVWSKIGEKAIKSASYAHLSKGIDEVQSTLENWPNLNARADTSNSTAVSEIEEGKKAAARDASTLLGRKNRTKPIN